MTDRLRFRTIARLVLSWGLLAGLCLACTVEEGERASSGECPEGEVCSEDTPTGLSFYGPFPTDGDTDFLPRLALRGSFNVAYQPTEGTLPEAVAESSDFFMTVEPADPERDEYTLWHDENAVRITAVAEGQAYLRVVDASTDELFDRVRITVEQIDTVYAVDGAGERIEQLQAGEPASIVVALEGESGLRLVDESMTVEAGDGELVFERGTWDSVSFDVPMDVEEVRFVVDAGHRRWDVILPVAT